ncbi:MAG: sensor histidine kinase [Bacteroidota bacterium]
MPVHTSFRFLLLASCWLWASAIQAEGPAAVLRPENRSTLDELRQRAEKHVASNLNRFGLESLRKYDTWLDTLSAQELGDSISILERQFERNSTSRHQELGSFQQQVDSLRLVKEQVTTSYHGLLRKSGIAFAIWLLVVVIAIQIRRRLMGKASLRLAACKAQEEATRKAAQEGALLLQDVSSNVRRFEQSSLACRTLVQETTKADQDPANPWSKVSSFPDLLKSSTGLAQLIQRDYQVKEALNLLGQADGDEKEKCDINRICETALDICTLGHSTEFEAPGLQVSRDLEKNLPQVSVNRRMVTGLLIDILDNAFQAALDKQRQAIKGYQPKVSISTRVLPRFVQVRVKDNGIGISEEFQKTLFEEFNTTRPLGAGTGLGLSESKRILTELHKGEIKIESDPGNGTDVYIKFFHA